MKCKGCGEEHDYPWGYCYMCTAVFIDMSRHPADRLNPQELLDKHIEIVREYRGGKE